MEWSKFAETPLAPGQRIHGQINNRFITVVALKSTGQLRCIDSICYHAGGPLGLGDIEEINGEACITCAWHNYPVSLEDGSKLYEGLVLDPGTKKLVPTGWKKKTKAQRVHEVELRGGEIWVRLSSPADSGGKFDSDEYSHSQTCGDRVKQGDLVGAKRGSDGVMPAATSSGQVFVEQRWHRCRVVSNERDGSVAFRLTLEDPFGSSGRPQDPLMLTSMSQLFSNVDYVVARIASLQRFFTPVFFGTSSGDGKHRLVLSIRDTGGAFTSSLRRLRAGDVLEVRKRLEHTDPASVDLSQLSGGEVVAMPQLLQHVVLISAGSGVVPLYNVCRNVLDHTPYARVTLVHLDRDEAAAAQCGDLIRALDAKRVQQHVLVGGSSSSSAVELQRVLGDVVREAAAAGEEAVDPTSKILVSWCGPQRLSDSIAHLLASAGLTERNALMVPFLG